MRQRGNSLLRLSVVLAGIILLSGCATLGPAYQKADKGPDNTGLVYFYRPSGFVGGGVAYDIKTEDNNVVTTLHNGGYFPYYAKQGEREFWARTESRSSVTIDVKPGSVHFVKGTVGVGFFVGRPHLIVVPNEIAEKEIVECKLIPLPAAEDGKAPKENKEKQ